MMQAKDFRILVVDDEEALREVIAFTFERKGFQVVTAGNGAEALAVIESSQVDLVISDIRMPIADGISLLESVRKDGRTVPVVILITGFSDVSQAECMAKGASLVMSKPFDRKELQAAVSRFLGIEEAA